MRNCAAKSPRSEKFGVGCGRSAAHKADRAAGESPVRSETNVPVVITDLRLERFGAGKLGSKSPVRSGTSKRAGRSIK